MKRLATVLLLLLVGLALALPAQAAQRRLALVVGINDYQSIPKLQKAVGDAEAMALKLGDLGFKVTKVLNPGRRALNFAISEFSAKLRPGDLALFHYSGHGVAIDGDNYLLPADVPIPDQGRKSFVKSESISLRRLVSDISNSRASARVFILDARRDNPFDAAGTRSIGNSRGYTRVESVPRGTFIMYSADFGEKALDRLGPDDNERTSVYTRVLLKKLGEPGKSIQQIASSVRQGVQQLTRRTGYEQWPAYYDALSGAPLILTPAAAAVSEPARQASPQVPTAGKQPGQPNAELMYWQTVKDAGYQRALLEDYLDKYPDGLFSGAARALLDQAKQAATDPEPETPEIADPSIPPGTPITESARIAEIQDRLFELQFEPGPADGRAGRKTTRAVREFQAKEGLAEDGLLTQGLLNALRRKPPLKPWATLAFIPSSKAVIENTGLPTRRKAMSSILEACGNCSNYLVFGGRECAVLALSGKGWGWAVRLGKPEARKTALQICRQYGEVCKVRTSVCATGP